MPAKKKTAAKKKTEAKKKTANGGGGAGLRSMRELYAMMNAILDGAPPDDSPAGRALQLVEKGQSAKNDETARKRAREALALDPDCVNAHRLLAQRADDPFEAADAFAKAVAAGERALGPEFLAQCDGELWLHLDARPYMSARQDLANSLWAIGRRDESVAVMRETLRLNKGDNQGIRYALVPALVRTGRPDEAAAVLAEFDEDCAFACYDRALVEFIRTGDTPANRGLLKAARKQNEHIWKLLTGETEPAPLDPGGYTFGSSEEADVYAHTAIAAWRSTSGAVTWLRRVELEARVARLRKPVGPTEASKARLKRVPTSTVNWFAGTPRMTGWMNLSGLYQRPWMSLVTHEEKPLVLCVRIEEAEPTAQTVWDRIVEAATKPNSGNPQRPAQVKLVRGSVADALEAPLSECGIRTERVDALPHLDFLAGDLSKEFAMPIRDGILEGAGVTETLAGRFYEAAAQYRRAAPWERVGYEAAISVKSSKHPDQTWYAVMMGGGGQVFGVVLYSDRDSLHKSFAGAIPGEGAGKSIRGLTLTYGEVFEISAADHAAAEKNGWPIAGPEAYPIAYGLRSDSKIDSLTADELELMEAAVRTIPDFVANRKQDDRAEQIFTVPLLTGPVEIALAWSGDRAR